MKAQFKYTSQIVTYGQEVKKAFDMLTSNVSRPLSINYYSLYVNEAALLHQIEIELEKAQSYELFLAIMLGRNDNEMNELKSIASRATNDERFTNVVFMVFDSTFGDNNYERFIEYMANAQCAARHNLADQRTAHDKNAQAMIADWMKDIRRGNFTVYVKGEVEMFSTMKLATTLNGSISPLIFNCGAEALDLLPKTFWKNQQAKETAKNILMFNTLDEILSKATGPAMPLKFLFQDAVDDNLNWKDDVDKHHPLYLVYDFVNRKIKNADKTKEFNLAEKFIELTRPPYGLFPSYAGIAMLAFAMPPWTNKIYSTDGKPRLPQHLVDDVIETFKAWENGKSSNKVTFTFETKEAGQLSKHLIKLFKLRSLKTYSDISSLKDARWAISHEYTAEKEEKQLLIEHYQKLMQIDGSEDYSDDIESLKEDLTIADTYIKEQNEKMKDYCLIAEKDGTVTYVDDSLGYGYANSASNLITVASGSSNYTVTTDDTYEFKVGDEYEADYEVAKYNMKVIDVKKYTDDATGKDMQTILFEPVDNMAGISEDNKLTMTIHKPVIKNVVYVPEKAVCEKSEGQYYVYTINDDGYRLAVDVTVGETVDGSTIIKSGLTAGEQVTIN